MQKTRLEKIWREHFGYQWQGNISLEILQGGKNLGPAVFFQEILWTKEHHGCWMSKEPYEDPEEHSTVVDEVHKMRLLELKYFIQGSFFDSGVN